MSEQKAQYRTPGDLPSIKDAAREADRAMSEATFQRQVRKYASDHGWIVFCTHDSRRSPEGEPDLRLIRASTREMVWAELKRETGKLTPRQTWAIDTLRRAGQRVYVWRPSDMDEIERTLG